MNGPFYPINRTEMRREDLRRSISNGLSVACAVITVAAVMGAVVNVPRMAKKSLHEVASFELNYCDADVSKGSE